MARFPAKKRKTQKTGKVTLTTLVPHDRRSVERFLQIDQSVFLLYSEKCCCKKASCKHKKFGRMIFTVFDLKHADLNNPKVRKVLRSLLMVSIYRGYIVQQCLNELRIKDLSANLEEVFGHLDAFKRASKMINQLDKKASKLIERWFDLSPSDARLVRGYQKGHLTDHVLNGIAGSIMPHMVAA